MKTTIYYFSGTGNSLWVARELAHQLPDAELVPIVGVLADAGDHQVTTDADIVGFVFPVHGFSMPTTVRTFLSRLEMPRAAYRFSVATRGGSPCRVFHHVDRILARQGQRLDAFFFVDMPNTWLLYWDVPTDEEFADIDGRARERVAGIARSISLREEVRDYEHAAWILENVLFPLLHGLSAATRYFRLEDAFYVESNCTGCGVCEQVCLAGKISIVAGRPTWSKSTRCALCMACIHTCPHHAIQLKSTKSRIRGRYHHPEVSRTELAAQKSLRPVRETRAESAYCAPRQSPSREPGRSAAPPPSDGGAEGAVGPSVTAAGDRSR